ncbi:DUF4837 family protein [Marinoscillum furvescens]|uniref:Uncharacterized protein DUF4837 n=1 Tax=Marinoscillum furvescens DSM 4134 TaxID=1122208 RepID=A0A3D9LJJ9_MARFU|nr:DUF4837 family protein [Marinoscillum furvescens]REE05983.1 uncharacterized protein DUF4837 [Marinoscillum furvescens DSM 4134]
MRITFLLTVFCLSTLIACKSTTDKVKKDFMPLARGEADEIILVIDSAHWATDLGDQMRDMYRQYMRGLPQDEPKFSLNKVNPRKLNDVFKHAKNMIFVMTLDKKGLESTTIREYFTDNSLKMIQQDSSLFYTVRRDEFAKGQIVLYLFGQNEEQLLEKIKDNRSRLIELFESAVRQRTREKVLAKSKDQLEKAIAEDHAYTMEIPFGYDLAKNLKDFVWLRKLEKESELNIIIHERPYNDRGVFNKVDELRDEITSTYLRDSEKPQLHIARQQVVPIFTERVTFNDRFAVEARGLWKVSDNSAGGPYVSYTVVDEASQTLYYVEGYVYNPAGKKKQLIREVEAIISTFKIDSNTQENPS